MRAFVGLDILETAFGVADSVELGALGTPLRGPFSHGNPRVWISWDASLGAVPFGRNAVQDGSLLRQS